MNEMHPVYPVNTTYNTTSITFYSHLMCSQGICINAERTTCNRGTKKGLVLNYPKLHTDALNVNEHLGCIFRTNEPVNTLKLVRLRLLKFNKCAWFDDTFLFGYEVMLDALTRLTPLK